MPKTKRLYHFLPTKWALKAIRDCRLKAAELDKTNDPFELLPYRGDPQDSFQAYSRWRNARDWAMLCLSENSKNPLMWGHYADEGKGMCLGFNVIVDRGGLIPEVIKVDYQPDRIEMGYVHPQLEGRESLLEISYGLVKSSDWKYEQEWRTWGKKSDLLLEPVTGRYFFRFDESLKLAEILIGPYSEEDDIERRINRLIDDDKPPDPKPDVFRTRLSCSAFEIVRYRP